MSNSLRRMQRRLSNHKRTKLNSRGKEAGPGRTAKRGDYTGRRKTTLSQITTKHDLAKADKSCRTCRGTGLIPTSYGMLKRDSKRAIWLACHCVPLKKADPVTIEETDPHDQG